MTGQGARRSALLGVILVSGLVSCRKAELVETAPALAVRTESGFVRGVSEPGIRVYRGIPYAAPPVGPLRWRPPQPAPSWDGVRAAEDFGPPCPQPAAPEPMTEDCLTLNVWTPADAAPTERWPVMVWIHGGGFRGGTGSDPGTYGDQFAREGVVLVTLNYRLGTLGFLAHPALEAEQAGDPRANYGVLDMVAALGWVQRNIEAFGGDPSRVTIFGESAGGMAVHLLMITPQAEGLFHHAIAQSGYGTWPLPRLRVAASAVAPPGAPSAEEVGESIVERATASGSDLRTASDLRAIPAERLAVAVAPLHLPLVDGTVVPDEPGILFARGEQHDVPFIGGGNSYDGSVMMGSGVMPREYLASWGERESELRALYADDLAVSTQLGASRLFGDRRYLLSGRFLARNMSRVSSAGYLYYFSFVPAAQRFVSPGALHAAEIGPLFGRVSRVDGERNPQAKVGSTMRAYWINFARTGDPNGPGLPEWPVYDPATDRWLVIDETPAVRTGVIKDRLDFLEEQYLRRVEGSRRERAPPSERHDRMRP
jgi:para-nitrobenzyl esterase